MELTVWVAERLRDASCGVLRDVVALHAEDHVCVGPGAVVSQWGGRDRPPCLTIATVASALAPEGECPREASEALRGLLSPPIRRPGDVERLGPVGFVADALLYGMVRCEDSPKMRAAIGPWAEQEGVAVTWVG
jgi:hypothetical protein